MRIRATSAQDLTQIEALFSRSYGALLRADYPQSVLANALPLITRARPELLSSGRFFVLEDSSGTARACGGWSASGPLKGDETRAHIRHVASDPDHLRRGYARAILDHAIKDAAQHGHSDLWCYSTRTAVAFYRACGFVVIAPRNLPLPGGISFPAIEMRRCA